MLHSYWFLGRRQPYKILALHEKYGPVVRTSPNELSFSSVGSWKDIYGFRQGVGTFIKSEFYDGGSFADQAHSIVSERDPVTHGKMRKHLSHAFSDRSLREQEGLIDEVVDELIMQLGICASGEQGADIVMWFNLATFDIIGSLAFGESFGGLKSGSFCSDMLWERMNLNMSGKYHFWIALVTKALRQGALADTFNRFPVLQKLVKFCFPKVIDALVEDTKTHEAHTMRLIERHESLVIGSCRQLMISIRRLQNPSNRPDFLTRILESRETSNISKVQLAAHASDFV